MEPQRTVSAYEIVDRRELTRLKWLMTLLPAFAIYGYETVRHGLLEPLLPVIEGNLIGGLLALGLAYGFAELILGIVERLQIEAVESSRVAAESIATMQERERLSRELHDGLAQVIAYLMVRIETIEALVNDGRSEAAVEELERLRGVADDLYVDVRETIRGLRTRVTERGFVIVLKEYLAEYEERHGITTNLSIGNLTGPLPASAEFQLFRIIQEALTNVGRHADARQVWVSACSIEAGAVEVQVRDDGNGFSTLGREVGSRPSFGLSTMRERAASLGGTMLVQSEPGHGTQVVVRIPVRSGTSSAGDNVLARLSR